MQFLYIQSSLNLLSHRRSFSLSSPVAVSLSSYAEITLSRPKIRCGFGRRIQDDKWEELFLLWKSEGAAK